MDELDDANVLYPTISILMQQLLSYCKGMLLKDSPYPKGGTRFLKFNVNSDDFEMPPDNDPMWAALEHESINDSRIVSRPEDPRISELGNEPAPAPGLDKLKQSIRDFVRREYDDDLDEDAFDNSSCIGIAETNVEDREDIDAVIIFLFIGSLCSEDGFLIKAYKSSAGAKKKKS